MKRVLFLACLILSLISANAFAAQLPDTGQTKCYDDQTEIACPQPGAAFYGQDAQYGPHLQSFTKLDDNGTALPDNATTWAMVRDNVTGLEWQQATAPGTYTWQQAIDYCESLSLGGHNDWRLPTIKELATLVDSSKLEPAINTTYFPGTQQASTYWSSTTFASDPNVAWYVYFDDGYVGFHNKYGNYYVRAVRAGQSGLFDDSFNFQDNGDGTVTDLETGLMWQQATAPGTYNWEQALAYCESLSLAGYSDWRLPNRNELQSLVDYSRYNPAIDTSFFPGTFWFLYWSSTTSAGNPSHAWIVYFDVGFVYYGDKYYYYYFVRAVRAGQCGQLGDLDSDTVCDDMDNCPENYNPGQQDCDGDGNADACDNDTIDPDGDGVDQACDICWTKPNPTQLDTNSNCPAPPHITDPKCGDACNVCMADYDNDGKVILSDLVLLKTDFGRTNCKTVPPLCRGDANGDGKVILSDLVILKSEFGRTTCYQ